MHFNGIAIAYYYSPVGTTSFSLLRVSGSHPLQSWRSYTDDQGWKNHDLKNKNQIFFDLNQIDFFIFFPKIFAFSRFSVYIML